MAKRTPESKRPVFVNEQCGCRFTSEPDGSDITVSYCPLHKMATKLLNSVKELKGCLENWMEIADKEDERNYDYEAIKTANKLIAKAEGK